MSLFESASLVITPNGTKASKLYAIKPTDGSGDLSVVRATTATRVNSAGLIESSAVNVSRLDYSNGSCPSILVEPQRTNLTQRSEEFDNGYWVKTNSDITSNSVIAPDGNLTADTFSDRVLTSQTYTIARNQSYTSGTAYTSSFFAKNLDRRYVYMRFVSAVFGTNKYAFFDLQLGTVISADSGVTAEIIDYGNGWFRCVATSTASSTTTTTSGIFIGLSDNGTNNVYTNPSIKSIYIWGAQLEAGANATSYIPTVASASVTRNADVISKTGISSLIGQTEGTIFCEWENKSETRDRRLLTLRNNNTNSDYVIFTLFSNNIMNVSIYASGVSVITTLNTGVLSIGFHKLALTYDLNTNGVLFYLDGLLIATRTATALPSLSEIGLGILGTTTANVLGSGIYNVSVWKTRLSNSELATLTTL